MIMASDTHANHLEQNRPLLSLQEDHGQHRHGRLFAHLAALGPGLSWSLYLMGVPQVEGRWNGLGSGRASPTPGL